ncbi:MAG: PrgI family protein [Candidatus Daviesbacteria bacterium]|nr:PrgI family protein [Candidatus Daviesbacteria bacterium]
MEEVHPIPQNVTSFQFKLVGDMTLKQFGYLAAGAGFAYLVFVLFSHDYPIIAWPIVFSSTILGIAFAFVPIGSRALDHWLAAFLKAVYSPTKRAWAKNGKTYKEDPLFDSRLVMYLAGTQNAPPAKPSAATITQIARPAPLPTQEKLQKTVDLAQEAQQLQMKIIQSERTLSQIKEQATQPTPIPVDYSQQASKILTDLKNLVNQASEVKQQIKSIQEPTVQPQVPISEPVFREKVKVIVPVKPKQAQIALTTFPNVINGIVKDRNNNYLEGVVAVIYDKEGLPVRALKTNKLGQFTGSTPLPNKTYTLELEKDNYTFDVLQIELTGEVLPPLVITAKS